MNEIELILTTLLNCQRHELYLDNKPLTDKQRGVFLNILNLRTRGVPLQYILGFAEFMGFKFKIREGVFITRPETEILVETVIGKFHDPRHSAGAPNSRLQNVRILDIGTGSGCIAVSLAKFLPGAEIIATDISEIALDTAQENARLNGVMDKVKFVHSDLFTNYELRATNYDVVVSNPPYIRSGDLDSLPNDVKYDPEIALDGRIDGLGFYRCIIEESPPYFKKNGLLIMELGLGQLNLVRKIAESSGSFKFIEAVKDYNGIDRVIVLGCN